MVKVANRILDLQSMPACGVTTFVDPSVVAHDAAELLGILNELHLSAARPPSFVQQVVHHNLSKLTGNSYVSSTPA